MMEVTQWFDPINDGQPTREGWYERDWGFFSEMRYWNGKKWESRFQMFPWRGLTSPAETTFKQGDKFTIEGYKDVFTAGKIIVGG